MLYKVKSDERSISCSAFRDLNPSGELTLPTKEIFIQLRFSISLERQSQNARLENSNVNRSHRLCYTHPYFSK